MSGDDAVAYSRRSACTVPWHGALDAERACLMLSRQPLGPTRMLSFGENAMRCMLVFWQCPQQMTF